MNTAVTASGLDPFSVDGIRSQYPQALTAIAENADAEKVHSNHLAIIRGMIDAVRNQIDLGVAASPAHPDNAFVLEIGRGIRSINKWTIRTMVLSLASILACAATVPMVDAMLIEYSQGKVAAGILAAVSFVSLFASPCLDILGQAREEQVQLFINNKIKAALGGDESTQQTAPQEQAPQD